MLMLKAKIILERGGRGGDLWGSSGFQRREGGAAPGPQPLAGLTVARELAPTREGIVSGVNTAPT